MSDITTIPDEDVTLLTDLSTLLADAGLLLFRAINLSTAHDLIETAENIAPVLRALSIVGLNVDGVLAEAGFPADHSERIANIHAITEEVDNG